MFLSVQTRGQVWKTQLIQREKLNGLASEKEVFSETKKLKASLV